MSGLAKDYLKRHLRNDQVEEPVGSCAERDTEVGQSDGESLSANDPGDGTPRRGKGGNEDSSEEDEELADNLAVGVSLGQRAGDDLPDKHDESTDEKNGSSSGSVDSEDTGEGHEDIDTGEDDLEDVGVVETGSLGELDTVREEEVDSGDLLADLDEDTDHGSPENAVLGREALGVSGLTSLLVLERRSVDLVHLDVDLRVVDGHTSEVGEVLPALLPPALLGEESRRLGREDEADEKSGGPDHLEGDGDSPRDVTGVRAHAPIGHGHTPDTEGDAELEGTGDKTSESGRGSLGLEDGDETGGGADTETSEESGDADLGVGVHSGGLG